MKVLRTGAGRTRPGQRNEGNADAATERASAHAQPYDPVVAQAELAVKLFGLIAEVKRLWRRCSRPACRRAQACRGAPEFPCIAASRRPQTPEQSARTAAELWSMLQERRRQLAAEGSGE
jgi:hypothetical protein